MTYNICISAKKIANAFFSLSLPRLSVDTQNHSSEHSQSLQNSKDLIEILHKDYKSGCWRWLLNELQFDKVFSPSEHCTLPQCKRLIFYLLI